MQVARVVAVIVLLGAAAASATPRGRLPLALRGIARQIRKERGAPPLSPIKPVPIWRRILAFLFVSLAAALACV